MDRLFDEFLGQTMIGGLASCLGVIFLLLDRRSRGNVAIAFFFILAGVNAWTTPLLAGQVDPDNITLLERLHILLEMGCVVSVSLYIRELIETAQATPRARKAVLGAVRIGYVLAGVGALLGALMPVERLNEFSLALDGVGALRNDGFWVFAGLWILVDINSLVAWIGLATQRLDPGERSRALAFASSVPFITAATYLPVRLTLAAFTITLVITLYGIFRYLLVQGERAAFLSRFLSPQVAELVRLRGLDAVMQPQELELSVVCIDFRGFTSYTEAIPTQATIDLISDYHEAIAEVVAEHDGMIKDYAGDGILILVGAPIARSDHAGAALVIARGSMFAAQRVTGRWATGIHPLGVGIGVASGRVTVGAIGEIARMDYTAVGTPVNLAARLCGAAADGEILLDAATAAAAPDAGLEPRGEIELKGLSTPLPVFAVSAYAPASEAE